MVLYHSLGPVVFPSNNEFPHPYAAVAARRKPANRHYYNPKYRLLKNHAERQRLNQLNYLTVITTILTIGNTNDHQLFTLNKSLLL